MYREIADTAGKAGRQGIVPVGGLFLTYITELSISEHIISEVEIIGSLMSLNTSLKTSILMIKNVLFFFEGENQNFH